MYEIKIKQIIPAEGWSVLYYNVKEDSESPYFLSKIACWALVDKQISKFEDDIEEQIIGMVTTTDFPCLDDPTDMSNFVCYVHSSDSEAELVKLSKERFELDKKIERKRKTQEPTVS